MKKLLLTSTTVVLFAAAALFTFSSSNGHLNLFKKASAIADNDYIVYTGMCSGSFHIIIVCGAGGNGCIPSGTCAAN